MAILEIELSGEEQTCLRLKAQAEGLGLSDWARKKLLRPVTLIEALPPGNEHWTLQDALDYAGPLPENLGRATALASEVAFKKFWESPEDEAAWRDM